MNPMGELEMLMARAGSGLEYFRRRGVPYVIVTAPSREVAEAAVVQLHGAGFMVDGVNDAPCGVRVKIPAAQLPDDPGAEHGRCAYHGVPLVRRTASRGVSGLPYCSVGGAATSTWQEAAGSC